MDDTDWQIEWQIDDTNRQTNWLTDRKMSLTIVYQING